MCAAPGAALWSSCPPTSRKRSRRRSWCRRARLSTFAFCRGLGSKKAASRCYCLCDGARPSPTGSSSCAACKRTPRRRISRSISRCPGGWLRAQGRLLRPAAAPQAAAGVAMQGRDSWERRLRFWHTFWRPRPLRRWSAPMAAPGWAAADVRRRRLASARTSEWTLDACFRWAVASPSSARRHCSSGPTIGRGSPWTGPARARSTSPSS
mmetsp:Transcript_107630/g.303124  ORF Transcript_107630/g.303124 Transcript_107630/m.303124 type:complete len:209 (-) Transcript_107630:450-1076(-)